MIDVSKIKIGQRLRHRVRSVYEFNSDKYKCSHRAVDIFRECTVERIGKNTVYINIDGKGKKWAIPSTLEEISNE